ncbi:MAG: hypothetical protein KAI95_15030, partial [Bacteroidales bacterium]|nr:hypothetical protein [Bacteroidales bacterium]
MRIPTAVLLVLSATITSSCITENDQKGLLDCSIFDENGKPTPARVYITGSGDSIYMADDCLEYYRPWLVKATGYDGRHFTTRGNRFTAHLKPGEYTLRYERGKEYRTITEKVRIEAGKTHKTDIRFERWINMSARGWYSADTHVHRRLADMKHLMKAEDLNLAFTLPYWNEMPKSDEERIEAAEFYAKADPAGLIKIDENHIFSAIGHEIEWSNHGAVLLMMTRKEGIPFQGILDFRSPTAYVDLIDRVH